MPQHFSSFYYQPGSAFHHASLYLELFLFGTVFPSTNDMNRQTNICIETNGSQSHFIRFDLVAYDIT